MVLGPQLPGLLLACAGFVLLAFVGPGLALQRLLRVRIDAALVLPVGAATATFLYWLSLTTHHPWLFPGLTLLLDASLLLGWRRPWQRAEGPSLRGAVWPCLALLLVFAASEYGQNRRLADGSFLSDPLVPEDQTFHVALSWELSHTFPPQVPGLSGFPLAYHLGHPLLRAAALRWAGIHPYDCMSRLDVTLWSIALVLVLRSLTYRLGGSPLAVALVPWTLLFTDLSFLFGGNPHLEWWVAFAEGNVLFSLLHANSSIPGMGIAVGSLLGLDRHRAGEGRGYLLIAAILSTAVPYFKVFLAAHFLLGLGVAFLVGRDRWAALATLLPAALALGSLVFGPASSTLSVTLEPLLAVRANRQLLALPAASGLSLALWALVWIAASLSVRVLGLGQAVAALRSGRAASVAVATIALSGWPIGLLFFVHPIDVLQRAVHFNEATYFLEQSGPLLWVFLALALGNAGLVGARAFAAVLGVAAVSLPSTVQFVMHHRRLPETRMPAGIAQSVDAVAARTLPGDVVLIKPDPRRYPPPPLVLAGRRVPFTQSIPYLTQFATRKALEGRLLAVQTFFETGEAEEARAIAKSLHARFVCLYGSDRVHFEPQGMMQLIFDSENARVYEILER